MIQQAESMIMFHIPEMPKSRDLSKDFYFRVPAWAQLISFSSNKIPIKKTDDNTWKKKYIVVLGNGKVSSETKEYSPEDNNEEYQR